MLFFNDPRSSLGEDHDTPYVTPETSSSHKIFEETFSLQGIYLDR